MTTEAGNALSLLLTPVFGKTFVCAHMLHVRPLPTHAAAHVCPVELLLGVSHGNGAIKGRATSWYSSATSVRFVQARLSLFHTMLAVFCYNSCEAKTGNLTFLCNLLGMCACIYLCSKMRWFFLLPDPFALAFPPCLSSWSRLKEAVGAACFHSIWWLKQSDQMHNTYSPCSKLKKK